MSSIICRILLQSSPSPYGVSLQIAIQNQIVELPEESMCHRILQAFWSSLGKDLQTEAI